MDALTLRSAVRAGLLSSWPIPSALKKAQWIFSRTGSLFKAAELTHQSTLV